MVRPLTVPGVAPLAERIVPPFDDVQVEVKVAPVVYSVEGTVMVTLPGPTAKVVGVPDKLGVERRNVLGMRAPLMLARVAQKT